MAGNPKKRKRQPRTSRKPFRGDLAGLTADLVRTLRPDELKDMAQAVLETQQRTMRESHLLYYQPVSKKALEVHRTKAPVIGIFGGNGSSKTEAMLAEVLIRCTGIVPFSLAKQIDIEKKFRGPIQARMVVESFTNTLYSVILRKLQWWVWTGIGKPGSEQGHFGWVPRQSLIAGSWEESWDNKLRTLRMLYRDPVTMKVEGESTLQFNSHDQDPSDFASGDYDICAHDEPPPHAIWIENQARTMRKDGTMMLAMTWPDDPSIPVDWIHDKVWEPGQDPRNDRYACITLDTRDNKHLNQEAIAGQMQDWDEDIRRVRIEGGQMRFSNRIHPLFTDRTTWWCFGCKGVIIPHEGSCRCGSNDIVSFCHVTEWEETKWPCVYALDPHPRKPHMMIWVQVDPLDDFWQIAELEVEGDPVDVRLAAEEIEKSLGLQVAMRLIDPNMGESPGSRRGITWQREFEDAGLICDLADDSSVGRKRLNTLLRPDAQTRRTRFHLHRRCLNTRRQMLRYRWDEYRRRDEKDVKQVARAKDDDYPTLLKYVANADPGFRFLRGGVRMIQVADRVKVPRQVARWH